MLNGYALATMLRFAKRTTDVNAPNVKIAEFNKPCGTFKLGRSKAVKVKCYMGKAFKQDREATTG